jgi:transposase
LYDVTSSYLEGTHNALAAFGYNRDGKKGKPQVVIGLLCDEDGHPVSIEVFPGNTQDPRTVASQIEKLKGRFGVTAITFVGDRGMIKGQQVEDLAQHGFHYITAITKPQNEASPQQAAGYQTEGHCRGDTTVSPPSSLCKVTSEQAPRNLLIKLD